MKKIQLDRFDLNLLIVLRAVLAGGSVTRAAERLSVTQSAVSHALRRLRSQTGDALFERRGAALVPTAFTKNLAAPLQRALRGLEDTLNSAAGFDPARSERRFVVGMDDRVELFALPGLAEALCAAGPSVGFDSVRVPAGDIAAGLTGGALDAVVSTANVDGPGLRRARVATDEHVVLARPAHPAVRGPRPTLRQYLAAEHIAVEDAFQAASDIDAVLRRAGHARRIRFRMQRYVAAVEAVARTDLLLTMPGAYARAVNAVAQNRVLRLPFRVPALRYFVYWSASADGDAGIRWLREMITRSLDARSRP